MLPLVAISYYDQRSVEPLRVLLDSLDAHPAGMPHERVLCVNRAGCGELPADLTERFHGVLERPNFGMNIGAWDAAWRQWRGRPAYLFLQHECFAVEGRWLDRMVSALERPGVGMVGESLNPAWDRIWDELRVGPGRTVLPGHSLDGRQANRVDVYLAALSRWGIPAGDRGRHLRSLVWAFSGRTLEALDGFPQGIDYGTCIAAEIGVSRAVEAMGLALAQVDAAAFRIFRHREWRQARPGGPFTHHPDPYEASVACGSPQP